jgi:hypothetical protein
VSRIADLIPESWRAADEEPIHDSVEALTAEDILLRIDLSADGPQKLVSSRRLQRGDKVRRRALRRRAREPAPLAIGGGLGSLDVVSPISETSRAAPWRRSFAADGILPRMDHNLKEVKCDFSKTRIAGL